MTLFKNALICMCALIQMTFAATPKEIGEEEGFFFNTAIFPRMQENAPKETISTAQRELLRELRRRYELECAALLASGYTANNDPVIQSCDTLIDDLTTNLEKILSTKWHENTETLNPRHVLEELLEIEQKRQDRRCMYNNLCRFDPSQMMDSMMRRLEYAQRISIWEMDSGYEFAEHRKKDALKTLETPGMDAVDEYQKMLDRSRDPNYKPWLDPAWVASSQEMLDKI